MNEHRPTLDERAVGAYLGLAVGDALGATTEFMTPREIKAQFGVHDRIRGGGWLHLRPGQVTDDTEMSLALGRSIIACDGVDANSAAQAFSDWMRSKPVDIGNTVRRGLVHFRTTGKPGVEPNEYDAGNGACMRSLPVALAYWRASAQALQTASRTQAHITHNNPVADAGTETLLAMLVAALRGEFKDELRRLADGLVARFAEFRFDHKPIANPSGWIVETLQVVFQAFFAHDNPGSILIDVVNRGGDSDTTGAIAGMLAGAYYGLDAIPAEWLKTLDREISQACREQAEQLLQLASRLR